MAEGHIETYLDGLGYPAKKGDLIDILKQNNAPGWMIDNVDKMPSDIEFNKYTDVGAEYDHFDPRA